MQLIKIEMDVPEIIQEVGKLMKGLKNESVIAGGCLSDSYMGLPFKDIDVFVQGEIEEAKLMELFGVKTDKTEVNFEEYESFTGKSAIYRLEYKGHKIEIIEVEKLRRVYDFDFRFRQLYYQDGIVKASVGAMEDMEKKRLVLINPYSSISTLCRMIYFQRKYGFKVEKEGYHFLLSYLNELEYDAKRARHIVQNNKRLTEKERIKLLAFLEKATRKKKVTTYELFSSTRRTGNHEKDEVLYFENVAFPFHSLLKEPLIDFIRKCASDIRYDAGFLGAQFEKIKEYTFQKPFESFDFTVQKEWSVGFLQELIYKCEKIYKKERLRMVTSGVSDTLIQRANTVFEQKIELDTVESFMEQDKNDLLKLLQKMRDIVKDRKTLEQIYKYKNRLNHLTLPQDTYTIDCFPEEDKNKLGDIVKHNTFCVGVYKGKVEERSRLFTLVFRKCTNRKFTISSVHAVREPNTWLIILSTLKELEVRYPDLIASGDESMMGIYDLFSSRNDHYFEDDSKTMFNLIEETKLDMEKIKRNVFVPFTKR